MSRSLVSWRFAGGLLVAAGLACPAPASAADPDVSRFAASPSPIKVYKFRASPIKDGVLSARVYLLNRGERFPLRAMVVLGLSTDPKVDPGDTRLVPPKPLSKLRPRRLVQVRMAARVPANIARDAKYAFACVVVPRSTNPESRPVSVARASGNPATGILDCKMRALAATKHVWDWSVPARYAVDEDDDGITDAVPPDGAPSRARETAIVPRLWPVKMKASSCSDSDRQRGAWRWVVEDDGGNSIAGDRSECQFTYGFSKQGEHDVILEKLGASGEVVAKFPGTVTVKDTLIVSLGDSIASGEGAPQKATKEGKGHVPKWQDRDGCHRSSLAGPAQAAEALENADPKTSVTFVHLACTGATMGKTNPITGLPNDNNLISKQIKRMTRITKGRKIDAVMLSIGANDIGFSEIAKVCFKTIPADCSKEGGETHTGAGKGQQALEGLYLTLDAELDKALRDAAIEGGAECEAKPEDCQTDVLFTGYPDPLRDEKGKVCRKIEFGTIEGLKRLTHTEAAWASEKLVPELNTAGDAAASAHGWTRVGGIAEAFRRHGYCAKRDRWINRYQDSKTDQGNHLGMLHPNAKGHQQYSHDLAEHLGV